MTYLSPFKPVNLHVAHSWGGGIDKWLADFCAHDARSENLVLRSVGTPLVYGLGLSLTWPRQDEALESIDLDTPVCETAIAHEEYTAWLRRVCDRYRVRHVYVSSLIGHSLDVLDTGIPTTTVHHDYYPYCVGLYLYFGRPCTSCRPDELAECLRTNLQAALFRQHSPAFRERLRAVYLDRITRPGVRHVCPSPSVAANFRAIDRRFATVDFTVVPHGIAPAPDCFGGAEAGRRLRVLMLGRLNGPKGGEHLRALFSRLQVCFDLYLLGPGPTGRPFGERANVEVLESYTGAELTGLLQRIRPDVFLSLSIVHETFSYTLSEAAAHGIPACARSVGAFTDRIEPGRTGFLYGEDPDASLRLLLELDADRERLRSVHRTLAAAAPRGVDEMLEDFYALRRDYPSLVAAGLR